MEIKHTLNKPYTDTERMEFIVKYNHKKGYKIEESEDGLNALGYSEEEIKEQNRQRIAMLSLTAADVERAIYKAKGLDFEDILEMIEKLFYEGSIDIDLKALKIELKANNFYRGNPYIEQVGALLGFTPEMLDEFFKTNDYTKLIVAEVENEDTTNTDELSI